MRWGAVACAIAGAGTGLERVGVRLDHQSTTSTDHLDHQRGCNPLVDRLSRRSHRLGSRHFGHVRRRHLARMDVPDLDGALYGEPLSSAGRVFVATENDTVYALSAGNGSRAVVDAPRHTRAVGFTSLR